MKGSKALLAATLTLAIVVFVSNALPSTVILDDETNLSPSSSQHRSSGVMVDLYLVVEAIVVALVVLGEICRPAARLVGALPFAIPIARAPPSDTGLY